MTCNSRPTPRAVDFAPQTAWSKATDATRWAGVRPSLRRAAWFAGQPRVRGSQPVATVRSRGGAQLSLSSHTASHTVFILRLSSGRVERTSTAKSDKGCRCCTLWKFEVQPVWSYTYPAAIRELADKNYELLKENPRHPLLQLKRIEELWSLRVGKRYRAIGIDAPGGIQRYGLAVMLITTSSLTNENC